MTLFAKTHFEGYSITDDGRILSHKTNSFLRLSKTRLGYLSVRISNGTKGSKGTLNIHREVAKAFIPNPHGYKEVNHKDLNKENNSVSNLEWCSRVQNIRHAFESGAFKQRDLIHSKASHEQKLEAIQMYKSGHTVKAIATYLNAAPNTVYAWFNELIPIAERKSITSLNISKGKLNAKNN